MVDTQDSQPEATRLENLWRGDFGDDYVGRNVRAGDNRGPFWRKILETYPSKNVLEIGCNVGGNLRWFVEKLPANQVYGIDVNQKALSILHNEAPGVNAVWSPARELPFRDRWFDMVFTMGVLIHQPDDTLPLVMAEMVRTSRRYVLCGEYYAEERTEVPYRGQGGALIKRDFGGMFLKLFPELVLKEQGFLSRDEGWDDITFWVFEKRA